LRLEGQRVTQQPNPQWGITPPDLESRQSPRKSREKRMWPTQNEWWKETLARCDGLAAAPADNDDVKMESARAADGNVDLRFQVPAAKEKKGIKVSIMMTFIRSISTSTPAVEAIPRYLFSR
jgi:hypothetical protein